jgi:hypothetical protein
MSDVPGDGSQAPPQERKGAPPPSGSPPRQFALAGQDANKHAKWLSDQMVGYNDWYNHSGIFYLYASRSVQVTAMISALAATILAAAPKEYPDHWLILGMPWPWMIATLSAVTTALTGALPTLVRLARDREDGRIEIVRLRQELDLLKGCPSGDAFSGAITIMDRIASIERKYGGGGRT